MSECLYSSVIEAKNGTSVPVFQNGRTFFSTYNPERDVDAFISVHKDSFDDAGCILIGGIGNGLHIEKLAATFSRSKIIAFEADESSLCFTLNHISQKLKTEISNNEGRIVFTSAEKLRQTLLTSYIPALQGNLAFAAVRSWSDYLGKESTSIVKLINETISDISADYSVQAQFGKLWHKNILINLSCYDSIPELQRFNIHTYTPESEKAAIIGAGPSLDESIQELTEKRSEYCIFATDTTFGTLKSAGITPDLLVTVDSQQISEKHFVGQDLSGTVLAADLSGNCSIIRHAVEQGGTVLLFHNNHPLSNLIDSWLIDVKKEHSPFPVIDSGAGTVLHAATDLAYTLGFKTITFFGADFSYKDGKTYTKGTYLEKQYYADDERTGNAETAYSRLMYRTPLFHLSDNTVTTEVLSRYRQALEFYLDKKGAELFSDKREASSQKLVPSSLESGFFIHFSDFIPWYLDKLQKKDKKVLFSVLPLAAWYKKNFPDADTECVYAFAEEQTANVGRIQCHLQKN